MQNEIISKIKKLLSRIDRDKQRAIIFISSILLILVIGFTFNLFYSPKPIEDINVIKYNVIATYKGSGKEALVRPLGVTSDDSGSVYVADSSNHRIVVFSAEGKIERIIGKAGTKEGELNYPTSVAIFEERLYVADSSNGRIVIFSTDGEYLDQINSLNQIDEKKNNSPETVGKENNFRPIAITLDDDENLYVTDGLGHRVLVFNKEGKLTKTFGEPGSGNGQFSYPNGIALDQRNKRIFVSDFTNSRIQIFSWEGKYKDQYKGETYFINPRGIAYDSKRDLLFVADIFDHRISVLRGDGFLLGYYGGIGSSSGKFHFPNGLFVNKDILYVTDRENHRVVMVKVSKK